MRTNRTVSAALVAAVAASLTAGCGSDRAPAAGTTTPTPTAAVPTLDAQDRADQATAVAALTHASALTATVLVQAGNQTPPPSMRQARAVLARAGILANATGLGDHVRLTGYRADGAGFVFCLGLAGHWLRFDSAEAGVAQTSADPDAPARCSVR